MEMCRGFGLTFTVGVEHVDIEHIVGPSEDSQFLLGLP